MALWTDRDVKARGREPSTPRVRAGGETPTGRTSPSARPVLRFLRFVRMYRWYRRRGYARASARKKAWWQAGRRLSTDEERPLA